MLSTLPLGVGSSSVAAAAAAPLKRHPSMPYADARTPKLPLDVPFNPKQAQERLDKLWSLGAEFGMERNSTGVYLSEIVSDRYCLINGLQILRDELQLAGHKVSRSGFVASDINACGADFGLPSVVTTVAHTNCGDRIHQGEATAKYVSLVASRFACMSEVGDLKLEAFSPTGGGTDDGATLAHVTVAHLMDATLRRKIYNGNASSYSLIAIDLMTHCGRDDIEGRTTFGLTQESPWREPRAACGAIVGCLKSYNPENGVHRRLREDLGEENFEYLRDKKVVAQDGTDCTYAVAAAIVAVQGMINTARALITEMDPRGLGHLTAAVTINRAGQDDTLVYLARATVFHGKIHLQGVGTDARKYVHIDRECRCFFVACVCAGEQCAAGISARVCEGKGKGTRTADLQLYGLRRNR